MEDLGATCPRGAKRTMILELMRWRHEHINPAAVEAETYIEILKNFSLVHITSYFKEHRVLLQICPLIGKNKMSWRSD